jgi:dTDP-4-dehydrorhamnose 3,5-epimerase
VRFLATEIEGVVRIELTPHADDRGDFARAYCESEFRAQGLEPVGVQCNLSRNRRRGTLRGLHYQVEPAAEAKLVRCVAGRLFDVAVDLRRESPTYRRWVAAELDARRGDMLYVPRGCAHGFLTLADDTTVFYQMSTLYEPAATRGVRWNDPAFGIAWPFAPICIGERDASYPDFVP